MRLLRAAHKSGDTRNGYDGAALWIFLLHHLLGSSLDSVEGSGEVCVDVGLEEWGVDEEELFKFADAGVGDEDVEPLEG